MIINHNLSAMNAQRMFKVNTFFTDRSMRSLASGMRINRGADDAAGLAVSEKMRAQISGLRMASRNAQDGISLIQTAEGFLQESNDILQRVRELSVQAANGVYTYEDRMQIQVEVNQLVDEVDRIANQAEFNTMKLLSGRFVLPNADTVAADNPEPYYAGGGMPIQIGANMDQSERIGIGNMTARALGIAAGGTPEAPESLISVSSVSNANQAIGILDNALNIVNKQRADLGAFQNRLEHAVRGIDVAVENTQAAESQIRDTDMAAAMVDFVKNSILSQASVAMLAQTNLRPQMVLSLLS
jgi:flagellin